MGKLIPVQPIPKVNAPVPPKLDMMFLALEIELRMQQLISEYIRYISKGQIPVASVEIFRRALGA